MATVKAPLMSMDASGTIGGAVVFSRWKGRAYVRKHAIPANPKSELQTGMRAVFKFITQQFSSLDSTSKADWVNEAEADNITALNAQVRDAGDRARRNLGWRKNLTDAEATAVDAPTSPSATAGTHQINLAWTDATDADANYCTAIYRKNATGVSGDISELIAVVAVGTETYTDPGLTEGDTWYYKIRHLHSSGVLGTLTSEVNATVT